MRPIIKRFQCACGGGGLRAAPGRAAGSPEWISGAEKRKRNGAPCRRRISGRGRRFGCCISLRPFCRTDSGLAFYGKNLQFPFVGIPQIFGNATKDRSIYQNRIDKALHEWYCNHILREGCGQDEEDVRSYCRSGCQGRRRILLRRKLPLYDRHYYGRHYGVHFCCHYFHYWHNSIWLAWGTERLSL